MFLLTVSKYDKFRPMADVKYKRASKNAFFLLLRVADELIGRIEDDIIEILTDLVFKLLCDGELYLAKVLRDKLLIRIKNKKNEVKVSQPLSSLVVHLKRDSLTDFSAPELAEQMTILDAKLFQSIEIPEVLLWAKEQSEELSPNLTIFTDHFNKMSYCHYSNLKENSKILAFFNDFHDFLDEEAMWQLSEKIKPRGSKHKDFL
ncbi:rap guanine nucleotide exchange factor 1-like [Saccoglossus kowalevskii]